MENGFDGPAEEQVKVTTVIEPTIGRENKVPYVIWDLDGDKRDWAVMFFYPYDDTTIQVVTDEVVAGELSPYATIPDDKPYYIDIFERTPKIQCSIRFKDPDEEQSHGDDDDDEVVPRYWFHLTFSWDIPTYLEEIRGE